MKKLTLILASVFAISTAAMAHHFGYATVNSYADAFVFDEMGVTFSVYPDGEFDFYLPDNQCTSTISNGYVTATFNSGYNYDPYVQYDDFGAVIQVENVPVYYDYYGRVSQIGDVFINYRNRRVCQVGGLRVFYNRHGHYAYHTGFINVWNPYFVYRPFYVGFARPAVNLCFVRINPYRQFYRPVRYTYYRPYVTNIRPCVATIGHTYRPSGYGVVHHRYTQTAGRGERAVVRTRRKITTADATPRPSTVNRGRATTARTQGTHNRNAISSKPSSGRSSVSSRAATSSTRTAKPNTSSRNAVSTKPRTSQAAPSRTRTNFSVNSRGTTSGKPSSTVNRSSKPRTSSNSGVSRSSSSSSRSSAKPATRTRTQSASRPGSSRTTTSSRQSSPSRSSVSSKPRSSSSSSRVSRSPSSSRSSASKPRSSSSSSRATSSSRGSSSVSKAPSRSSSSRSTSKGSPSKNRSVKRR